MKLSNIPLIAVLLVSVVGFVGTLNLEGFHAIIEDRNGNYVTTGRIGGYQGFFYSDSTQTTTFSMASFVMPTNDTAPMTVQIRNSPNIIMCCGDSMFISNTIAYVYSTIQSTWLSLTFITVIASLVLYAVVRERETQEEEHKEL